MPHFYIIQEEFSEAVDGKLEKCRLKLLNDFFLVKFIKAIVKKAEFCSKSTSSEL